MLPNTCYNCGAALGKLETPFRDACAQTGWSVKQALEKIKVKKMCCRILFMTYIEEPKLLKV